MTWRRRVRRWWPRLALAAVLCLMGCRALGSLIAVPRSLTVEPAATPQQKPLGREDFWTAIRDVDLGAARRLAGTDERRRFVAALGDVTQGDWQDAIGAFQSLRDAGEERIRHGSTEALERLLRGSSRWQELGDLKPGSLEAETYRGAPAEHYEVPAEPVRLPARIGWLRIPRIRVHLNERSYLFAVDTGASATVVTDRVATDAGIEPSERSRFEATSTQARLEWRTGLAEELRLGAVRIRHHPVAIVRAKDLDLGIIRFDGVLGWPVFQHLRIEIDYRRGEMTLARPVEARSQERNLFWLGYPMVKLRSESGIPLYFGVDTGARATTLKPNALNKLDLGPLETSRGVTIGVGGRQAGLRRQAKDLSLHLDGHRLRFQKISIREGVKGLAVFEPDGQLGGDVTWDGTMIFDFVNGRFEIERK